MGECATKLQSELRAPLSNGCRHSSFPEEPVNQHKYNNDSHHHHNIKYDYLLNDVYICKLLISGYFRTFEKQFKLASIPSELHAICADYYFEDMDTFDVSTNCAIISDVYSSSSGFYIQKTNSFNCVSIYGTKLIPSPADSKTIYKWTFIVSKRNGLFVIGLTSNNNENDLFSSNSLLNNANDGNTKYPYYGYNGFNGAISDGHNEYKGSVKWMYNHGPKINDNDKIEMELDLGKGQIAYYMNDTNEPGVCFHHIKKGIIYRMVVSIYMQGDAIEIVRFEEFENQNKAQEIIRVGSEKSDMDDDRIPGQLLSQFIS